LVSGYAGATHHDSGTGSYVGKNVITAALCRYFYHVWPEFLAAWRNKFGAHAADPVSSRLKKV
jgi:hypothetical protein